MKIGRKWAGAVLVFITGIVIEAYIGVSLDKIYWLNLIFHDITNVFMTMMPNTGPFAQATENTIFFVSLIFKILCLVIDFGLAVGVYKLIPNEY